MFVNSKGEICEGSSCNIFFVKDNHIYTPSVECGMLPGIFRNLICKNELVKETKVKVTDLQQFDECFVTNSIVGVMKVRSIGGNIFQEESVSNELQKKYKCNILSAKGELK